MELRASKLEAKLEVQRSAGYTIRITMKHL